VIVERFHEILIWPLRLHADAGEWDNRPSELQRFAQELSKSGEWEEVSPYGRLKDSSDSARYAEFVYFHPFIRSFLYPRLQGADAPMRVLAREDIQSVRVRLRNPDDGLREIELRVLRVHLYLFQTGIGLLVVEVAADGIDLLDAEDLLDTFRRAYAPYFEGGRPGHCPFSVEWVKAAGGAIGDSYSDAKAQIDFSRRNRQPPVSRHWQHLLDPLAPWPVAKPNGPSYSQIEDERIPVMAFLSFSDPALLTKGDFARLAFLDDAGPSGSLPCAAGALEDFESKHCYDRFWDATGEGWMKTRYLCSGYAFVVVGQDDPQFFTNGESGILSHFRHHYLQMGLVAHMHRASLLVFSQRLSAAVDKMRGHERSYAQVRTLQQDIADFVAHFWFTEVSNQQQPRELFEWWSNLLGNRELYDRVLQECGFVAEVLQGKQEDELGERQEDLNKRAVALNRMVVWFTGLVVAIGIWSIDPLREPLRGLGPAFDWPLFFLTVFVCYQIFKRLQKKIEDQEK
jgi:hypothetical protein